MREGMVRELDVGSLPALEATIASLSMSPGWIRREVPLLWKDMKSVFVPHQWKYVQARELMVAAGKALSTDVAERRNFILRNPIEGNDFSTLRTIICAYQTMLPGEKAMSHRHAPHAMRVLLESNGAYSVVNGHKHPMDSGDIVLTPGGCWHGHGHEGSEQAFWLDGLDVPLTHLLEPMFYHPHPQRWEPVTNDSPRSPMRFARADIARELQEAPEDTDGFFGRTILLDTANSMPTLTLKVHGWKKGWRSRPQRHTPNSVYVVLQGSGSSWVGEQRMDWSFGDVIAVPGWTRTEHQPHEDSLVCSISDEQLMRFALYYRQEAVE
ncbi:MAG TPA: cupin domain-containing protein [Ramlibacter sp.]|jgi:gentisate 1,2-dioxygenase|nr:cupin domain-containing protein [Ramlibacter sp.]